MTREASLEAPTAAPLSAEYAMISRMPLRTGPLIGRDADLSRLADAIGLRPTPGARPGGVVVLSGDAGIGKSRILGQLLADATAAGWFTGIGHCVGQAGSSLAYLPFVELVGRIDAGRPDVVERVLETHPSLAHLLPGRADAYEPDRAGRSTDPGQVAEAVHALLVALGDAQPSLVVIEDVHWADHSSRDLITLLLTRGFASAVGLVVTYRSDDLYRRHPLHETLAVWARIAGLEHVELAPLADDAVRELVSAIEDAPSDAGMARLIARRSEGNPFFAEELVASAAAGQSLSGGLSRVLRSRVEQLDDTAQRVLRAVALKGGRFITHDLLSRVVDLPEEALDAAIAAAVEHHVLEARWPPAYSFRHALLGETVADGLLPGERLRLHRSYAAVLTERPDLAPASELARHAAAVGDLPTAVRASLSAAQSAMEVGGPQEALLHLERALGWLGEDDRQRDDVTLRASRAAMVAGDAIRAIDLLRDRLDHPGTSQDPRVRADLLAMLVIRSRILDLPVDSIALTDEALSLIGDEADERRVRVLVARVQAFVDNGSFVEAAVVGNEVSLLAERLGMGAALAEVRTIMARILEAQQDLDSVEAHLRSVVADIAPDDPLLLRAVHQLASLAHRRGDLPGSLALYDRGAEVARRMHREWAPWGQECRLLGGLTAYEIGDWDGAFRRLDLGARPAPQPGRTIFTAAALLVRSGRGDPVDPDVIGALREWWHVDGLCVVLTIMPAVDLLGQTGDLAGMLDLTEAAVGVLDATWGEYHAIVRLAALVAGQCTALVPAADPPVRARAVALVDELTDRARLISQLRPAVEKASRPIFERSAPTQSLEDTSRETWAWTARLEADLLRLQRVAGVEEPPPVTELVGVWRESVAAFERYGHVFETARSRARLAEALRAAGHEAESREVAEQAREVAVRLEAKPLLAELDAVRAGSHGTGAGADLQGSSELTPRELEVLELLARGLTNGQIGKQLYISTKTVSVHVSNLLAKLGASGRTEAAAIARRRGLVS